MSTMRFMGLTMAAAAMLAAVGSAQQPTFKRTELQRGDLSAPGREVVTAMAEIPGGAQTGKHMHPGEEVGYVVEGTLTVEIDGKPTMTYKAGQAFIVPAGQPHNGKNAGTGMTKVLANYIIEKGKPVATPVP